MTGTINKAEMGREENSYDICDSYKNLTNKSIVRNKSMTRNDISHEGS